MPERVGYYSPETARMVLDAVAELRRAGFLTKAGAQKRSAFFETHGIAAVTPATGIDGMSNDIPGSAVCNVFRIDYSVTPARWVAFTNANGEQVTATVYNIASTAIGGTRRIMAKKIFGAWVVDMEDCP